MSDKKSNSGAKALEQMSRKELFKKLQEMADFAEETGSKIEDLATELQQFGAEVEEIIIILTEGMGGEFLYDIEDNVPTKKGIREIENQLKHMRTRVQELESQLKEIQLRETESSPEVRA